MVIGGSGFDGGWDVYVFLCGGFGLSGEILFVLVGGGLRVFVVFCIVFLVWWFFLSLVD